MHNYAQRVGARPPSGLKRAAINHVYVVQFFELETELFGHVDHLMVQRIDKAPIHSWWELQLIKDTLGFAERFAVEVFPPHAEIVDDANLYHVWIFAEGLRLPFAIR